MENLQIYDLMPNMRIRGFFETEKGRIISGSFANYSNNTIKLTIYETGIIKAATAIQINDHLNECAYVIYCDTYEFAEVNENA